MLRPLKLFSVVTVLAIAGCFGGPTHPINPPNASIQQLDVLPDGKWKLQIRLENFSDKTVHYAALKAALRVGGEAAGDISLNPDMDIPGENADVVEITLARSKEASKAFLSDVGQPGGAV